MTNSEQAIREFVDKWGMGYFDDGVDYGYKPTSKKIEECLSDLTSLISEHYVAKEEVDKMVAENLVEFGNMIRDEPNGDIAALAEYFMRTINLKSREK